MQNEGSDLVVNSVASAGSETHRELRLIRFLILNDPYRLLHVGQDEVAVSVVGVQGPAKLPVSTELDVDALGEREAKEVKRLRNGREARHEMLRDETWCEVSLDF